MKPAFVPLQLAGEGGLAREPPDEIRDAEMRGGLPVALQRQEIIQTAFGLRRRSDIAEGVFLNAPAP